jgi:hypothetical protein
MPCNTCRGSGRVEVAADLPCSTCGAIIPGIPDFMKAGEPGTALCWACVFGKISGGKQIPAELTALVDDMHARHAARPPERLPHLMLPQPETVPLDGVPWHTVQMRSQEGRIVEVLVDEEIPEEVPELDPEVGPGLDLAPTVRLLCTRCKTVGGPHEPTWRLGPEGWEHQCADRTPYATHPGRAAT